jgi:hypothetical protein
MSSEILFTKKKKRLQMLTLIKLVITGGSQCLICCKNWHRCQWLNTLGIVGYYNWEKRKKDLAAYLVATFSGSLVTTAWRVLRLRMEEKASRYGG